MEILPAHHYQFSGILTSAASLFLVVLVYKKGVDRYLKTRFALYYLSLFVWSLSLFICTSVYDYQVAYFFSQMTHAGAILIPVFFLHFTFAYLANMSRSQRVILWILYAVAAFFMVINLFFRDLFFGNVVPKLSFPYFPNAGIFYTPWVVTFAVAVIFAHVVLFRAMMTASGIRKQQIRFFLLANALGYFGGIGCFLPVYDLPYFPFPYGPYGVFLLSLVSGYAILRYRFMDLQLLLKKSIVFTALFAFIIGIFSFMVFIFQNILSSYINVNPFLISAISAVVIISVYNRFRDFLINVTDKYLFQKKQEIKVILRNFSEKVVTILGLKQVSHTILSTLEKAFRLESGIMFIRDKRSQEYRVLEYFGLQPEEFANSVRSYFEQPNVDNYFLNLKSTLTLDHIDSSKLPREVENWLKIAKARVCVPLLIDEDLTGILVFGKKTSDQEFSQEEIDFFPTIESQVSLAIRNARLIETVVQEREAKVVAEKTAEMVRYASSIKHEIKNAVVGVMSAGILARIHFLPDLQKLRDDLVELKQLSDDTIAGRCQKIYNEIARFVETVIKNGDKIFAIANTAAGILKGDETKREEIYLKVVWDEAKEVVSQALGTEGIRFSSSIPDGFKVFGYVHSLEQVLVNLITNAFDATHGQVNRRIHLQCCNKEVDGKKVAWCELSDNGPGVPSELRDKIFEHGYSTKKKPKQGDILASGSGKGLYVCKVNIETMHGGKIWVESELEKGAKFVFWIPFGESQNQGELTEVKI